MPVDCWINFLVIGLLDVFGCRSVDSNHLKPVSGLLLRHVDNRMMVMAGYVADEPRRFV
jgi:hypothetical protein